MSASDSIGVRPQGRALRLRLFAVIICAIASAQPGAAQRITDIRAVFVASDRLLEPDASERLMTVAQSGGFNTLFVPMSLEEGASASAIDSLIGRAHERGLRVHAWVQLTRASDAIELPASRDHVIYRHPEWLMVPRELAVDMLAMDPRGPDYIGRLARWGRTNPELARGVYLSPLSTDAATHVANAVKRMVTRHALDGVHLDAVSFPAADFDYSRSALAAFRAELRSRLSAAERDRLDQVEAIDPFGSAEDYSAEWRRFRVTRLTALVARVRNVVRSVTPDAIVSANVTPGAERALADHFQDWRTWLDNGFVDALTGRGAPSGPLHFSYDALIDSTPASASSAAPGVPASN
jgi:uncharacterized lipoprotein YddW (UPF0748 family)